MSLFSEIPKEVPDKAFAMIDAFRADTDEKKVNLSPGIYRDENAKTWVLPSVKKARQILEANPDINHDISPQMGIAAFVKVAREITFANTLDTRAITSMQTIAGTGANHFIAELASIVLKPKTVWFSDPSWDNHTKIWTAADSTIEQRFYPYYNAETSAIDAEGLLSMLRAEAKQGDVIVLQACAHNPTGLDPSRELWKAIGEVVVEKGLFPVFDSAYQGFATGSLDDDAWAIRHFATLKNSTLEMAVCQSFSKNFGLYGERIGALHIVASDADNANKAAAALKKISRSEITASPGYPAKIVSTIVQDPELREQWQQDMNSMSGRMRRMRQSLYDGLKKRGTPGKWDHLLTDIGMFSMSGLYPEQVNELREKYHVYLFPTGRISLTGLTEHNVDYVAAAIHEVATTIKVNGVNRVNGTA